MFGGPPPRIDEIAERTEQMTGEPHQLALPLVIPGGGQLRPTQGTPEWFRDLVALRFGRPPDPTRARPGHQPPRRRRTTAA